MIDGAADYAHPCTVCGYDLRHNPRGNCPECGASLDRRTSSERNTRRFVLTALFITFGLPAIAFLGLMLWFLLPNLGLPFGYYGNYNRVHRQIRAVPNVTVTNTWLHRDLTLEDFGFELLVDKRWKVEFDVPGGHDCRGATEFTINLIRVQLKDVPLEQFDQSPQTVFEILEHLTHIMEAMEIPTQPHSMAWDYSVPRPRVHIGVEPVP